MHKHNLERGYISMKVLYKGYMEYVVTFHVKHLSFM